MELENTARCLEALGNPTRLAAFRLLVQAGPAGAPVGLLQEKLGIPASTLSHHLARLMKDGLVTQERQSRTLICRAEFRVMAGVLAFLQDNCCGGLQTADGDAVKIDA